MKECTARLFNVRIERHERCRSERSSFDVAVALKRFARPFSFVEPWRIVFMAFSLFGPAIANGQPFFPFFEPISPPRLTQVMVHRGMSIAAPENSAAAVDMCVEDYCEWVQIDVRLTKDGQHVIIHDATVDRVTNGKGNITNFELEELKQLDAGSWFATRFGGTRLLTLREVLSRAKNKINLCLECHQIDAKLLVQEIISAGMERQVVVSSKSEVLLQIKHESKGTVATLAAFRPQTNLDVFLKEIALDAVAIEAADLTAEICHRFHSVGIKVQARLIGRHKDAVEVWKRVVTAGADWLLTDDPAGFLFFNARRKIGKFPVMLSFHRGANRYAPENTIPAISESARLGADYVELDLRTTKDGRTVLLHDTTVDRTTNHKGAVRDLNFAEVTSLTAGTWFGKSFRDTRIPSLEEGIQAFGDRMAGDLDLKNITPEELIQAIKKHQLAERHVVYQKLEYCAELRQRDSTIRVTPPLKRFEDLDTVSAIKPYGVDADWSILSQEMIAECHRRSLVVFSDASGPNESLEQYLKAIRWKLDCIRTDYPLRVLRAIELIKIEPTDN